MLLVHFLVSATDPLLQYIIENSINIVSISRRSLPGGDNHVTVAASTTWHYDQK